jgi:uncharacterized membrane protein YfcA
MDFTLAIVLSALLIGLSKGGLLGPFGGTLALPLMLSAVMDGEPLGVATGTAVLLPLLMLGDLFAVRLYWPDRDNRYLWLMLPAAVLGIVVGTLLLTSLPNLTLKRILGGFTLLAVIYRYASDHLRQLAYHPRDSYGWVAGLISGFGSALANTGGPPITAYLMLERVTPRAFVGTQAVFFTVVNILKVPGYAAGGLFDLGLLLRAWPALIIVPLCVFASRPFIYRVNRRVFDTILTIGLIYASLSLLLG